MKSIILAVCVFCLVPAVVYADWFLDEFCTKYTTPECKAYLMQKDFDARYQQRQPAALQPNGSVQHNIDLIERQQEQIRRIHEQIDTDRRHQELMDKLDRLDWRY
jgi:hypothetical protein